MKMRKIFLWAMFFCGLLVSLTLVFASESQARAEEYDNPLGTERNIGQFIRVEMGEDYTIALTDIGRVFSFGFNDGRALGIGKTDRHINNEQIYWMGYYNGSEDYRSPIDITASFIGMDDDEKIVEIVSKGFYNTALSNHGRLYYFGGTKEYETQFALPYDITPYFNLNDSEIIVQSVVNGLDVLVLTNHGNVLVLSCENYEFALTDLTDNFIDFEQNDRITFISNNWVGTNNGNVFYFYYSKDLCYKIANVTTNINLVAEETIVQAIEIPDGFALLTNQGRVVNSNGENITDFFKPSYESFIKKIAYNLMISEYSLSNVYYSLLEEDNQLMINNKASLYVTDFASRKNFLVTIKNGQLYTLGNYIDNSDVYFEPTAIHMDGDPVAILNSGTNYRNDTLIIVYKDKISTFGKMHEVPFLNGEIIQAEIISRVCQYHCPVDCNYIDLYFGRECYLHIDKSCTHYLYSEVLLLTNQNQMILIKNINYNPEYIVLLDPLFMEEGEYIEYITVFNEEFCAVTNLRYTINIDENHGYADDETFSNIAIGDKIIKHMKIETEDLNEFYFTEFGKIYHSRYRNNLTDITASLDKPIIDVAIFNNYIIALVESSEVYFLYENQWRIFITPYYDSEIVQMTAGVNHITFLNERGDLFVHRLSEDDYGETAFYLYEWVDEWVELPELNINKIYAGKYQTFLVPSSIDTMHEAFVLGLNNNNQLTSVPFMHELPVHVYLDNDIFGFKGGIVNHYLEYIGPDEVTIYGADSSPTTNDSPFDGLPDKIWQNLRLYSKPKPYSTVNKNRPDNRYVFFSYLRLSSTKGLLKIGYCDSVNKGYSNEVIIAINMVQGDRYIELEQQPEEEIVYGNQTSVKIKGYYHNGYYYPNIHLVYEFSVRGIVRVQYGKLVAVGVGETQVKIYAPETVQFNCSNEIVFTIRVVKAEQVISIAEEFSVIQKSYGESPFSPVISGAVSSGEWHCESSDDSVAYMDEDGLIRIGNVGSAELTITKLGDVNFANSNSVTITVNVIKEAQIIEAREDYWYIDRTYGDPSFTPIIDGAFGLGIWSGESTNSNVAYMDEHGVVHLVNAGEADLFVKKLGDGNYYDSNTIRISILVNKANQVLVRGSSSFSKKQGDPAFSLNISGGVGTGEYQFKFSLNSVVEIDQNLMATVIGGGNVSVEIYKLGDQNFLESNKVTVLIRAVGIQEISHNGASVIYKTYGDDSFQIKALGGKTTSMECESLDLDIATVDSQGNVTIVGVGTVTITLKYLRSTIYEESNVLSFIINVAKGSQDFTLNEPSRINKSLGDVQFTLNVINGEGTGLFEFISSDINVVTVDANGVVTIVGTGTAQILIKKLSNAFYNESLTQRVMIEVLAPQKTDQYIESEEMVYEKFIGDDDFYITILGGMGTGEFLFTLVSGDDCISLSPDGKVTIIGIGFAEVTIKKLGDAYYNESNEETVFIIID